MAFHVACPITCRRICFCSLGFSRSLRDANAREEFLVEVNQLDKFLKDTRVSSRDSTVQIKVPKVSLDPQTVLGDGDGATCSGVDETAMEASTERTVHVKVPEATLDPQTVSGDDGIGSGVDETAVEASAQTKRVAFQIQAAAELSSKDHAGEELAQPSINVMCRMCFVGESDGSERARRMLPCKDCGKKYHKNCLKPWAQHRDLFHWSSWTCPSCRVCEVCHKTGDPKKFMFCKRCDAVYHCYCKHPPHKNATSGPYLCPNHTRCHSCDSTVPGKGLTGRWFLSYACCEACWKWFVKGNYCPGCLKVYRDSELAPMVCCDICQRWVHCPCDGISDEKYLQFQADENLQYKCNICRGECNEVKDHEDAVREVWKKKDAVEKELIASLRAATGLPFSDADDDENGTVSARSLKRKRPSSLVDDKASLKEDGGEATTHSILKNLGKDSIGKRVEVRGYQSSWHKGTVSDIAGDSSTFSVSLDDGRTKTFELGKHSVRFIIPENQKRSNS